MMSKLRNLLLLTILIVTAQSTLSSQSILPARTYPYITLDQNDSIIVVFTPAQYDGIVKLIVEYNIQNFELNSLDSLLDNSGKLIDLHTQREINSRQQILDNELKFNTLKDLYKIKENDYSDVVNRNLQLNIENKSLESSRSKWRAYGITATIVGVVVALISIN